MNSGLIARILAGGMALSVLGVSLRYGSQYDSIQEGIQALKEKGVSFYNQYLVSEEAKNKLQDELNTLKEQYLDVLEKLGLGENATLEDVQSKLEELTQGGKDEVVTTIADLLGIENATVEGITQAIEELEEVIAQLETDISRLQTELEQANLDLAQANKEDEDTVALLNSALAELNALEPGTGEGEEEGSEPGEEPSPVDPVDPPVDPVPELTEEQQALKTAMETAWTELENRLISDNADSKYYADIKNGNFEVVVNGTTSLKVNGNTVVVNCGSRLKTALENYRTALDNYNASFNQ